MFKSGSQSASLDCLTTDSSEEDIWNAGQEISMMSCQDAIAIGDGREVFVMEPTLEITIFKSGLCLESVNGLTSNGNKIQT